MSALVVACIITHSAAPSARVGVGAFASVNWLAALLALVPAAVLPTIVYVPAGADVAAAAAMAALFFPVLNLPGATLARSLFAEGSRHPEQTPQLVRSSAKMMLGSATGVGLITFVFAPSLLGFFGTFYAEQGTVLLRLLAASAVVATGNFLADTIILLQDRIVAFAVVNVTGTVLVTGLSFLAAERGPVALGWAWVAGQGLYSLVAWAAISHAGGPRSSNRP